MDLIEERPIKHPRAQVLDTLSLGVLSTLLGLSLAWLHISRHRWFLYHISLSLL